MEQKWGAHRRLPDRRKGYTLKCSIGSHKFFLRTGEYEDGTLGEIRINLDTGQEEIQPFIMAFCDAVSIGLQRGVPLETFVEQFRSLRAVPRGTVRGHDRITSATSIFDLVVRELAIHYLGRDDLADGETNKT